MSNSPLPWRSPEYQKTVKAALHALGIERLVLAIHDVSFPADAEDVGAGTPYGEGGRAFFEFAHALGFTGVQLGPQGETSEHNPSPYDGTLFARSTMALALPPLPDEHVPTQAATLADHAGAWTRQHERLDRWFDARTREERDEAARWASAAGAWLPRDADYVARASHYHSNDWRHWPTDAAPAFDAVATRARERFVLAQWLAHRQHAALRAALAPLSLKLYGDLQAGISHRDAWRLHPLFLRDYYMGAPASRTTPGGQPWSFPVLDPAQYETGGAALIEARIGKMLDEYDGLRIDHPHALVDPWVYRCAAGDDPQRAVSAGARLFSSPDLADHPRLAAFAIARPEQLDRTQLRYADAWVRDLDVEQVDRYAALFDRVVACVRAKGRRIEDQLCEVLSTLPYTLRRVLERQGFGRLIITQKAKPDDPNDVYRIENARPADWVMVGNHDTPPLWRIVDRWHDTGAGRARAAYLGELLAPEASDRSRLSRELERSSGELANGMFAALFSSRATSVSIFFADLFGMRDTYNEPGLVAESNWRLRVPPRYEEKYAAALAAGPQALDLMRALALALRAKRVGDASLLARVDGFAVAASS